MHPATVCPVPPLTPEDGTVELVTPLVEVEVATTCASDNQMADLTCHFFQTIHILNSTYGRGKESTEVCGEEDEVTVQGDCWQDVTTKLRSQCRGESRCTFPVSGLHTFTDTCSVGQRNLVEVEHVCVECRPWHTTVGDTDCPGAALLGNAWATEAELTNMTDVDKLMRLQKQLSSKLNGSVHSLQEVVFREVQGEQGSLCGMAGFYQALQLTLLTRQSPVDACFSRNESPPHQVPANSADLPWDEATRPRNHQPNGRGGNRYSSSEKLP